MTGGIRIMVFQMGQSTHIGIVTTNHLPITDLMTETISRLVRINWHVEHVLRRNLNLLARLLFTTAAGRSRLSVI